jgi:DNA-directed RNA polymerase specialized sigma24 family protein
MMIGTNSSGDEAGLLASARRGSLDAFNQLVLEYQDGAWNLAFHLLWNEAAAEKVVQKAVQEIYREVWLLKRGSFRLHLFHRIVRACQRILKNEPKNLSPDTLKYGEGAASSRLASLPLPERIVLILSELEGLSPPEIAAVTGTPIHLVRLRLGGALSTCVDT